MRTYSIKKSEIMRNWHVVDASGQTLGRLASEVAQLLKGKHKPIYSRHMDTGDFVIVINAAKIRVTGNKPTKKIYYRHTGYPGGLKTRTYEQMMEKFPTRVIEHAVKGMLPKNPLGRAMYRKLKVYDGPNHPHQAQIKGQSAAEEV